MSKYSKIVYALMLCLLLLLMCGCSSEENNTQKEAVKHSLIDLKHEPAQNVEELAKIIENVILETGNVEECFIMGTDKEVSTGGYWISAEVKIKDKYDENSEEKVWTIARNAVLSAYINKCQVPLTKVSVGIIMPSFSDQYALQVVTGKDHLTDKNIKYLNHGSWGDFKEWVNNNSTRDSAEPNNYSNHLWSGGLF